MFSFPPHHSVFCSIISQLENLKKEAADVQRKVEETDVVMAEVERVSQQYLPLSTSCSSLYFTLDTLNQVCRAGEVFFFKENLVLCMYTYIQGFI